MLRNITYYIVQIYKIKHKFILCDYHENICEKRKNNAWILLPCMDFRQTSPEGSYYPFVNLKNICQNKKNSQGIDWEFEFYDFKKYVKFANFNEF